jgi:hypothetical protein
MVLALGLVHQIVFKRYLNFEQIGQGFALFSKRWLVVEFVPGRRSRAAARRIGPVLGIRSTALCRVFENGFAVSPFCLLTHSCASCCYVRNSDLYMPVSPESSSNLCLSDKPLVSVTLIFLNAERFIEEAIESVLRQTYENWELLLVDDGSTDGSTEIARSYTEHESGKVRYLEHDRHENRGMSASRN